MVERFSDPLPAFTATAFSCSKYSAEPVDECLRSDAGQPTERSHAGRRERPMRTDSLAYTSATVARGSLRTSRKTCSIPFFTTKAEGLGLGLAICRSIITLHSGWISARNNSDRGATVELRPACGRRCGLGGRCGPQLAAPVAASRKRPLSGRGPSGGPADPDGTLRRPRFPRDACGATNPRIPETADLRQAVTVFTSNAKADSAARRSAARARISPLPNRVAR